MIQQVRSIFFMSLDTPNPRGTSKSWVFAAYSLDLIRKAEFTSWLISNGYAGTTSRANQIHTQAREYYFGDTGTVTKRPHTAVVNLFAAEKMSTLYDVTALFTSEKDVEAYNTENPGNPLTIRLGSGSDELELTSQYYEEGGLTGIAVVVSHGEFSYVYCLTSSL